MTRPMGTGGDFPLEYLRQIILEGLAVMAGDMVRLDDAFERHDQDAVQYNGEKYGIEAKRRVREMIRKSEINVASQYPIDRSKIPTISVMVASETEARGSAPGADLLAVTTELMGTEQASDDDVWLTDLTSRAYRRETMATQYTTPVQVAVWANQGDVFLLFRMLRQVLLSEKGRLSEAGIMEYSMQHGGFTPDPDRWPDIPFVLTITMTCLYEYRFDIRRGPVPTHLRILDSIGAN